jgi:AbrB family looped-hinge helix DNA binding protein
MAKKIKLSRLQERGQVTIPIEIREKLGLEPGDMIAFIETERGVFISPQEMVAMDALDKTIDLGQTPPTPKKSKKKNKKGNKQQRAN